MLSHFLYIFDNVRLVAIPSLLSSRLHSLFISPFPLRRAGSTTFSSPAVSPPSSSRPQPPILLAPLISSSLSFLFSGSIPSSSLCLPAWIARKCFHHSFELSRSLRAHSQTSVDISDEMRPRSFIWTGTRVEFWGSYENISHALLFSFSYIFFIFLKTEGCGDELDRPSRVKRKTKPLDNRSKRIVEEQFHRKHFPAVTVEF